MEDFKEEVNTEIFLLLTGRHFKCLWRHRFNPEKVWDRFFSMFSLSRPAWKKHWPSCWAKSDFEIFEKTSKNYK